MPLYEYVCDACGPFAAMRPLSAFAAPCECPDCGAAAPRNLLASPALGGSGAPAAAPAAASPSHAAACACCRPSRGLRADAVGG
jgi:putative FmdB family regulatory protein